MAGNCLVDTTCVNLTATDTGLRADVVLSALPNNAVSCIPGVGASSGLFMFDDESEIQAFTVPAFGVGWGVDLSTVPVDGLFHTVPGGLSPVETFPNTSACLAMNVISIITMREVLYTGVEGAHFEVQLEVSENGGAFGTAFNIQPDYRFARLAPFPPIQDARPGGSTVVGPGVIAPGGSYMYQYRIGLRNNVAMPAGNIVSSPGLTYAHLSVTN
jgi:hypothetical protein